MKKKEYIYVCTLYNVYMHRIKKQNRINIPECMLYRYINSFLI